MGTVRVQPVPRVVSLDSTWPSLVTDSGGVQVLRKIAGLFLVAHAVAHAGLAAAPIPNDTESLPGAFSTSAARSWLLPRLGLGAASVRWVGIVFVALTALGFLVAGLGVLGVPGMRSIWRGATAVSAVS